jgi:hypothetical protein
VSDEFFQGITMEEVMDVDNSSIMSNHPTVTVGSDGHHIVLGGSHNPATIPKVENHPRKIQPQVKLASKDLAITLGSSSFRIAPSNMQGYLFRNFFKAFCCET